MARATGPLFSMSASGTLNDTLVFSHWKGRAYVRTHVIPHNPRVAAQTGIRAMFKFLSQGWKPLDAPAKTTWLLEATAAKISPFNRYVQENMRRWREFKGPAQDNPPAEAANGNTVTLDAPTGGPRNIVLAVTPSLATNMWGFVIYRDVATIVTANWNLAIAVIPIDGTNEVLYTDAPLNAGTYHYRVALVSQDGTIGTACADQSGAAT